MSNEFSRRFSSGDGGSRGPRPGCLGDEDYYDPDDQACEECSWRPTCSILIQKKTQQAKTRRPTSTATTTKKRKRTQQNVPDFDFESEIDVSDDDTFFSVAAYNAGLNSLQGFTSSIDTAVRHIPRKSYSNLFEKLNAKKEKK